MFSNTPLQTRGFYFFTPSSRGICNCGCSAACPRLASATTSKVKEVCKCGVKGEKSELQHKAKLFRAPKQRVGAAQLLGPTHPQWSFGSWFSAGRLLFELRGAVWWEVPSFNDRWHPPHQCSPTWVTLQWHRNRGKCRSGKPIVGERKSPYLIPF